MSIPTKKTTFGTLKIEDQTYPLFSIPFGKKQEELLALYKKSSKCGYCSAPWVVNKYHWEVVDNKLYLIEINYGLCPKPQVSFIRDIFGEDRVFASWASGEIKALVSVIAETMIDDRTKEINREVIIMMFKRGILKQRRQEIETVQMRVLKSYIEE